MGIDGWVILGAFIGVPVLAGIADKVATQRQVRHPVAKVHIPGGGVLLSWDPEITKADLDRIADLLLDDVIEERLSDEAIADWLAEPGPPH